METIRDLFLKYLTVDSEIKDARRKEFNQAIFIDPADMVMEKFDKAVKEYNDQNIT